MTMIMNTNSTPPAIPTLLFWLFLVAITCVSNVGFCYGECRENERDALLQIKNDLQDPSGRLASWAVSSANADCCSWFGVTCDNSTGHILELRLARPPHQNYLMASGFEYYYHYLESFEAKKRPSPFGGKISPFLLNLTHLKYLDLSNNEFEGIQIPKFLGSMESLIHLNLSRAGFGTPIPPQLGNLTNLLYLNLHEEDEEDEEDSYPIMEEDLYWLSGLSSLQFLDLSGHNLIQNLNWMEVITKLPLLQELHLSSCWLPYASDPSSILNPNISSLSVLDLSVNGISESIVSWISHLKHLKSLNLADTYFPGSNIPREFQNLTSLTELDLSWNGFKSSIPNWLYHFANLEHLNFARNQMKGKISDSIANMTSLMSLDLSYNREFTGGIPASFKNLCNLRILSLSSVNLSQEVNKVFENLSGCGSNSLVSLDLLGSQVSGNLVSKDLGQFKSLAFLDLSSNLIFGPIPSSLVELKSLRYLDLSSNLLNGNLPANLGNLKQVEVFHIHANSISGPIPKSLGQMRSLRRIDFSRNQLNGTLPNSFENLKNLREVCIKNNSISGPIPMYVGGLSSLEFLDLSSNKLNSTLAESFGRLSKLEFAYIGDNSMEGDVSEIHFANLSSLKILYANGNKLNLKVGPDWMPPPQLERLQLGSWNVGPRFPTWLPYLKNLTVLDLSNSKISTSSIPVLFWSWSSQLVYLNLSHNNIQVSLPNKLFNFPIITDLSSNYFHGALPLVTSSGVEVLDLSNNSFSGSISNFLCRKNTTDSLIILNLEKNLLDGEIPNCWNSWGNLEVLKLSNNKFNGSIPDSIESFSNLASLHLRNNSLSGEVPLSLGSCSYLVTLDIAENQLEGKIPRWIGEKLSHLVILDLGMNNFSGSIPQEICYVTSLHILNLANNNLSGTIPTCMSNFHAMANMSESVQITPASILSFKYERLGVKTPYITDSMQILIKGVVSEYKSILGLVKSVDFSSNKLSGEIPEEIASLKALQSLNLSHNSLSGKIPKNIGSTTSLESIDFCSNQLIGEIPQSISNLTFLGHLNLSYNKLSGRIPLGTQIQGFDSSSFIGNELCGKPLTDNCTGYGAVSPLGSKKNGNSHDFQIEWLYVTMALGFIVGFWAVVGPLLFNRNWRLTYFQFLQRVEDKIYIWWHFM